MSDAFAHAKFIGWTDAAAPLLEAAGIKARDDGMIKLSGENVDDFVALCRQLRHWPRETE